MKNYFMHKIVNLVLSFGIIIISVMYAAGYGLDFIDTFINARVEHPIHSVERKESKIAVTFDTAWGDEYTEEILKILEANRIEATFFLVGGWVDKYPERVKKIYDKGHEIGNHSTTHSHFTQLESQKIKEEIYITSNKIRAITGEGTVVFRPPFGDCNSKVVEAVYDTGHYCIKWDVDSQDWRSPGEESIYRRVTEGVSDGSIILFHSNASQTPKVLDRIIKALKRDGYEFVRLSDLIYRDNYYVDHTGRQRYLGE